MLSVIYAEYKKCWVSFVLIVIWVLSAIMLSVIYAECHLCWVYFVLSVTNKPFLLSAIMLSVIMLSVIYAECHLCWVSFMLSVIYAEYRKRYFNKKLKT
jgi:hypothetical protein